MEDYLFGFPVWIVASNPRENPETGKLRFDGVGVAFNETSTAVAMFTEELFAERFVERADLPLAKILRIDDPLEMADILEEQQRRGCEYVAIDPQPGMTIGPGTKIWHAINALRKAMEHDGE
jgi:hypothetical protein